MIELLFHFKSQKNKINKLIMNNSMNKTITNLSKNEINSKSIKIIVEKKYFKQQSAKLKQKCWRRKTNYNIWKIFC